MSENENHPDQAELEDEDDELLDRMQTPQAIAGYDALFEMTPEQLGQAAVRGAKKDRD
jgi:hypothetical protein